MSTVTAVISVGGLASHVAAHERAAEDEALATVCEVSPYVSADAIENEPTDSMAAANSKGRKVVIMVLGPQHESCRAGSAWMSRPDAASGVHECHNGAVWRVIRGEGGRRRHAQPKSLASGKGGPKAALVNLSADPLVASIKSQGME